MLQYPLILSKSTKSSGALICYQTLRWRQAKKPFWLGIAKTKMFKVPEMPPEKRLLPDEAKEVEKMTNFHKTFLKSLKAALCEELSKEQQSKMTLSEKQIEKSYHENRNFNAESARRREARLQRVEQDFVDTALSLINEKEAWKTQTLEKIEEFVREEKNKTFITEENIDDAIEECLKTVTNFNFAIDLEGNLYKDEIGEQKEQKAVNK